MLFHRTQPLRALVVATSVASLGAPGATPGVASGRPVSLSKAVRNHFHGEQYRQYRKACYRLAFMARSIQETAGVFGALGFPVKLTCGIALSLVQALEVSSEPFTCPTSHSLLIQSMVINRQICSDLAELVTRHLTVIRKELDGAAIGDAKFRSLVEDYTE